MPPDERREDRRPPLRRPVLPGKVGIASLAAEYLRAVVRAEPDAIDFPAAVHDGAADGGPAAADRLRRREWRRQWRRLRLADQVAAYTGALAAAVDAEGVHAALANHATEIVGAYTSIVFVPDAGGGLASLPPHPRPLADGVLHLAERPDAPCLLRRGDLPRFPGLARVFDDAGAVSVVCQPLSTDAVLVLLERRGDRNFDAEDWRLLGLVALQAEAALHRLRSLDRVSDWRDTDTGIPPAAPPHLYDVLEHVDAFLAEWDEPLTVAAVELEEKVDSQNLRLLADELRRVCGDEGVAVCRGAGAYLVVLPGVSGEAAGVRLEGLERRLPPSVRPRHAIATRVGHPGGVRFLIDDAQRTLRAMRKEAAAL